MVFQSVLRVPWICLLLFTFGSCVPTKKTLGQTGSGTAGSGYSGAGSGTGAVYGSGGVGAGFGSGAGYTSGVGSGFGSGAGYTSGVGSGFGSGAGLWDQQDAGIARTIEDLLRFRPDRPEISAWTSSHQPLSTVDGLYGFPVSHVVQSGSGYQRARDSRSDAQYSMDTFGHVSDVQQGTGSKGHKKF